MHSLPMQIILASYWELGYQTSTFRHTPCASWNAAVAQMVEHVIRNDGVEGSSPFSGTTNSLILHNPPKTCSFGFVLSPTRRRFGFVFFGPLVEPFSTMISFAYMEAIWVSWERAADGVEYRK